MCQHCIYTLCVFLCVCVNVYVHLGLKKEGKKGAPVTQRESDDNGTVFARCVTSPEGGTLVHCASGLIV